MTLMSPSDCIICLPLCPVPTMIVVAVCSSWIWLNTVHSLQGPQGSQAQVVVSTISGASSQEVQSISNTLQQSVSSGQFANSLRQSGAQTSACHLLEHSAYMQPCTELGLPAGTHVHDSTLAHAAGLRFAFVMVVPVLQVLT